MTGAETTIVLLHLKNRPTKYFVHRPNMFGKKKKHFFLTAVKTVMLKLSPICRRFDEKSCKIHVCSHSSSMSPFWIGFRSKKSLQASKTSFVYWLLGRHSPQTSGFLKNSLQRPREKFSKQIWRPRKKRCLSNQTNLTNQPPGQKYRPEKPINL